MANADVMKKKSKIKSRVNVGMRMKEQRGSALNKNKNMALSYHINDTWNGAAHHKMNKHKIINFNFLIISM